MSATARATDAFSAMDRNHDGQLSREEFYGAIGGGGGQFMQEPVAMAAPHIVSYSAQNMHYAAPATTVISQARPVAAPAPAISYGPATTVQAPAVYVTAQPQHQVYTAPASVSTTMFNQLDRNHDGVLSRAEFQGAVMQEPTVTYQPPAPTISYGPATTVTAPAVYMSVQTQPQAQQTLPPIVSTAAPQRATVSYGPATTVTAPAVYMSAQTQPQVMQEPTTYQSLPPIVSTAAPVQYQQPPPPMVSYGPATTVTAPPVYISAQTQPAASSMSMFDQLDRNHDGIITRAEFAAPMASMQYMQEPVAFAPPPPPAPVVYAGPATTVIAPAVYMTAPAQQMQTQIYQQEPAAAVYSAPQIAPQILHADPNAVITTAAPVYVTAQPRMQSYGPATTVTAPAVYQQASTVMQEPRTISYAAPVHTIVQSGMFDQLDRNHDGVLTREEFGVATQFNQGVVTTAAPVYVTSHAVAQTQPRPMQTITTATEVAAPVYVGTTTWTAPAQTYAAPQMQTYAAPQVMTRSTNLFDSLDRNHDGILSREEFARATQAAPVYAAQTYAAPIHSYSQATPMEPTAQYVRQ